MGEEISFLPLWGPLAAKGVKERDGVSRVDPVYVIGAHLSCLMRHSKGAPSSCKYLLFQKNISSAI
jgi:hypothetical protein